MNATKPEPGTWAEEIRKLDRQLPPNPDRVWADAPGFLGIYVVSNDGRVGSLTREIQVGPNKTRRIRTRVLRSCTVSANGKPRIPVVGLYEDGKRVDITISRLVLLAFVGEGPAGAIAHTKDGDCANVVLTNLEWSTVTNVAIEASNGGYYTDRRIQRRLV